MSIKCLICRKGTDSKILRQATSLPGAWWHTRIFHCPICNKCGTDSGRYNKSGQKLYVSPLCSKRLVEYEKFCFEFRTVIIGVECATSFLDSDNCILCEKRTNQWLSDSVPERINHVQGAPICTNCTIQPLGSDYFSSLTMSGETVDYDGLCYEVAYLLYTHSVAKKVYTLNRYKWHQHGLHCIFCKNICTRHLKEVPIGAESLEGAPLCQRCFQHVGFNSIDGEKLYISPINNQKISYETMCKEILALLEENKQETYTNCTSCNFEYPYGSESSLCTNCKLWKEIV